MILYEDAALVVLDKPAGLSSEEGVPAALRAHWNAPDAFVGVVHRLDTGVSGLMVYARTPATAAALSRQVTQSQDAYAVQDGRAEGKAAAPQFVKQYRAVIAGAPDAQLPAAGLLRDYLFKDSRKGRVFPVSRPRKGVREAVLEYRILATAGENSLAEITLHLFRRSLYHWRHCVRHRKRTPSSVCMEKYAPGRKREDCYRSALPQHWRDHCAERYHLPAQGSLGWFFRPLVCGSHGGMDDHSRL